VVLALAVTLHLKLEVPWKDEPVVVQSEQPNVEIYQMWKGGCAI
jgi:hypothetical protein